MAIVYEGRNGWVDIMDLICQNESPALPSPSIDTAIIANKVSMTKQHPF